MTAQATWSDDRIAMLKKLWHDGRSASQIAGELGGVSRNAVISKIHRLDGYDRSSHPTSADKSTGERKKPKPNTHQLAPTARALNPKNANSSGYRGKRPAHPATSQPPKPRAEPPRPPFALMLPLDDLTSAVCHWPIGDPGTSGFGFCGAAKPNDPGVPYCRFHARLAFAGTGRR